MNADKNHTDRRSSDREQPDRRQARRLAIDHDLIVDIEGREIVCRIMDISPHGMGIQTNHSLPELAILNLELEIEGRQGRPDLRVVTEAVVIHCVEQSDSFQVGLWFQNICEFQRLNIERYILESQGALS